MYDISCFTLKWDKIAGSIICDVDIYPDFIPGVDLEPSCQRFKAILDTGANHSCITKSVVDACHLKHFSVVPMHTPDGLKQKRTYMVTIQLIGHESKMLFPSTEAAEVKITGADALIGMDILTKGDLVITNYQGRTVCTERRRGCCLWASVPVSDINTTPPTPAYPWGRGTRHAG